MSKYYFRDGCDICYDLEGHLDFMEENGIDEMVVFEAKQEKGTGYFFCKFHGAIGEVGEVCGKAACGHYMPNNGKNGRCSQYGYVYSKTSKTTKLQLTLC